jgi:nucleotide-binding universal stress UspA family protein
MVDDAEVVGHGPVVTKKTILVATALNDAGRVAVQRGAAWAKRADAKLIVAHALASTDAIRPLLPHLANPVPNRDLHTKVEAALAEHVDSALGATDDDHDVELVLVEGTPHAALVGLVAEVAPALVVVGESHKATLERLFIGSTAERLVRHAGTSVLVARATGSENGPVLAATDLSGAAAAAIDAGVAEARARGVDFAVVHALDVAQPLTSMFEPTATLDAATVESLQAAAAELCRATLAKHGVESSKSYVVLGPPARAIAEKAAEIGAGLLVVAPQGHSALEQLLLGSVAEAAVRKAECSVLVAR